MCLRPPNTPSPRLDHTSGCSPFPSINSINCDVQSITNQINQWRTRIIKADLHSCHDFEKKITLAPARFFYCRKLEAYAVGWTVLPLSTGFQHVSQKKTKIQITMFAFVLMRRPMKFRLAETTCCPFDLMLETITDPNRDDSSLRTKPEWSAQVILAASTDCVF